MQGKDLGEIHLRDYHISFLLFLVCTFYKEKSPDMRYHDLEGQSARVCGRNNNSQMMYYNVRKKVIHFGLVLGIQTNKGQELMILGFCGLITWHTFEFRFRGCLSLEKIDFGLKNIPQ